MFQYVGEDDAVVGVVAEIGGFDGGIDNPSIIWLGRVGPCPVGVNRIDFDLRSSILDLRFLRQQLPKNPLLYPHIDHLLRPRFFKESFNLLMAALLNAPQPEMFAYHDTRSNDVPARTAPRR